MDNNTISLQELLDSISRLREDVNTLTVAGDAANLLI
ncbi:ybl58 [Escherichia coli]|nr:ybl58 [Escherichia coli]CTX08858.1 ybl58 [Escherichia coli]CTZ90091.1 ybl58 [Escherichia coli]